MVLVCDIPCTILLALILELLCVIFTVLYMRVLLIGLKIGVPSFASLFSLCPYIIAISVSVQYNGEFVPETILGNAKRRSSGNLTKSHVNVLCYSVNIQRYHTNTSTQCPLTVRIPESFENVPIYQKQPTWLERRFTSSCDIVHYFNVRKLEKIG